MVQGQALGELAVLGAVGRAHQAVETLPEVVLGFLSPDLGEQGLLALPALLVATELGTDFPLALAQPAHPFGQGLPFSLQPFAVQLALRRSLQALCLGTRIGQQGLGIPQLAIQALMQCQQGVALGIVQQCGQEGRLVGKGAARQALAPGIQLQVQLVPGFLDPLILAALAALELVEPLLRRLQLALHSGKRRLGIVNRRQGRLPGVAGRLPAPLPQARLFASGFQCVLLVTQLAVQSLAHRLVHLPLLPFGLALGQPGISGLRQAVAQGRQASGQLFASLALLGVQLFQALAGGLLLLVQALLFLFQQCKLAGAVMQRLVALLAQITGRSQRGLERVQSGQTVLQRLQPFGMAQQLGLQGGQVG
ncbi:hypothetical protein D9M70_178370 [compost metagenome]